MSRSVNWITPHFYAKQKPVAPWLQLDRAAPSLRGKVAGSNPAGSPVNEGNYSVFFGAYPLRPERNSEQPLQAGDVYCARVVALNLSRWLHPPSKAGGNLCVTVGGRLNDQAEP